MRVLLSACLLVAVGSASPALAQVGGLSGTIRVQPGRPLVGAYIFVAAQNALRAAHADSSGAFRLDSVPAGRVALDVICPGGGFEPVPTAYRDTILVQPSRVTPVHVEVPMSACEPRAQREVRVTWRGHYRVGFEEGRFFPCPTDTLAVEVRTYGHPFRRSAWVRHGDSVWLAPNLGQLVDDPESGGSRGFVHLSGVVRGPGSHGHMGISHYELVVDSIYAVVPNGTCQ